MDNGSEVTLVRNELLPKIKEHNDWTLEQCHQWNRPIEAQPIGASGQDLGAMSVVVVKTDIEQMGQKLVIPCFVMTSVKPIWQGNVKDCGMVLGTNALVEFAFQLVNADGSVVTNNCRPQETSWDSSSACCTGSCNTFGSGTDKTGRGYYGMYSRSG